MNVSPSQWPTAYPRHRGSGGFSGVFFHPSRWFANYGPTQRTEWLGQAVEGTRIRSCTRRDADSPEDRISSWDLWNLKGVFRAGSLQILWPDTVRSPRL